MGGGQSSMQWQPPPEPVGCSSNEPSVDYYVIACQVTLNSVQECCTCTPSLAVNMDCDEMYTMMKDQYKKGYRLVHFTRAPGDMNLQVMSQVFKVTFQAYFRKNPADSVALNGYPITWQLDIMRSWVQSIIHDGGAFSMNVKRVLYTNSLVEAITRRTQNGERLVAACTTGHCQAQSMGDLQSGYGPQLGVELFFEVPCPRPSETYVYNLALVPIHVEFSNTGVVYFPEIAHNWMATFKQHLDQGWRLVDIYVDIPMTEQLMTPQKNRWYRHCRHTETSVMWIFEKPRSRQHDQTPFYEGTIVEQLLPVKVVNNGICSQHNSLPQISDMGSRGWELATVLECHSYESASWNKITIKSLLFFQRPLM